MEILDNFKIFIVAIIAVIVLMTISAEIRCWTGLIQDNNNAKEYAKEQKEYYAKQTEYYTEMINFYRKLKELKEQ